MALAVKPKAAAITPLGNGAPPQDRQAGLPGKRDRRPSRTSIIMITKRNRTMIAPT